MVRRGSVLHTSNSTERTDAAPLGRENSMNAPTQVPSKKLTTAYVDSVRMYDADEVDERIEALQLELKNVAEQYTNYHDWAQAEIERLRVPNEPHQGTTAADRPDQASDRSAAEEATGATLRRGPKHD